MYQHIALVVVVAIFGADAIIEQTTISPDIQNCFNNRARTTDITRSVGASIHWKCVQMYVWKLVDHSSLNITITDRQWIDDITSMPVTDNSGRKKRQAQGNLRVRREYRRMTAQQRENYHRAVNLLKQIPIGNTNRYDFLANIHRGDAIPLAHGGPNFLGWHRVYLVIYENALRQVVPGVTIPYWASSLDSELPVFEQTQSAIWSELFLGNGDGFVTSGPFANWQTPSGPLTRNIGLFGELYSNEGIGRILNRTRTSDIVTPNAPDENNIESQHDGVHLWIGGGNGQMNDLNTASQDPAFFNHHAFVDYIWEEFRQRQIALGIDPANDYPAQFGNPLQAPQARMQFGNLLNIDGYSNYFTTNIYRYEAAPTCTRSRPSCRSDYLRCDTDRIVPRCVALRTDQINERNSINKRQTIHTSSRISSCSANNYQRAVQNRYVCNSDVDIREWVYIPVDIVYRRPPEMKKYPSFPLFNSQAMVSSDIYSPESYNGLGSALPMGHPASYRSCNDPHNNAGRVFVKSVGLNYFGSYSEYSVVDNRLALSRSTSYVAIKSPEHGMTEVLVSAHDSCGRVCSTFCRTKRESQNNFQPCNGALRVLSTSPKQYSRTYGESVLDTWDFPSDGMCPDPNDDEMQVRFYCDYNHQWPWSPLQRQPLSSPSSDLPAQVPVKPARPRGANTVGRFMPSVRRTPVPTQSNKSSVMIDSGATAIQGCLLGYGCVVKAKCGPCKHGLKRPCIKSHTLFAMCNGDKYMIRKCVGNSHYNAAFGTCRSGAPKVE